jgi:hypothetical protein
LASEVIRPSLLIFSRKANAGCAGFGFLPAKLVLLFLDFQIVVVYYLLIPYLMFSINTMPFLRIITSGEQYHVNIFLNIAQRDLSF